MQLSKEIELDAPHHVYVDIVLPDRTPPPSGSSRTTLDVGCADHSPLPFTEDSCAPETCLSVGRARSRPYLPWKETELDAPIFVHVDFRTAAMPVEHFTVHGILLSGT